MASEQFRFVLSANPCDICQSMQGTYPYRPGVPVHPNCDCTYDKIGGDSNCTTEIRNVRCQTSTSSETRQVAEITFDPPLTEDTDFEIEVTLGVEHESWDDARLEGACDWSPPSDTLQAAIPFPAGTSGTITISVEMTIKEVIAAGELWEVCRRPAAPGGYAHTLKEKLLSRVGGGAMAVTGLGDITATDGSGPEGGGHYEDDDEVPV